MVEKLVEGDYLETMEGLFFAVKGFRHPDGGVIAYLRYVPCYEGERLHHGERYRRVYDIEDTTEFLATKYPHYIGKVGYLNQSLQVVPLKKIRHIYKPNIALKTILERPRNSLEKAAKEFVLALNAESKVPVKNLGISGSLMTRFATKESDIDLIVYGERGGRRTYEALSALRKKDVDFRAYHGDEITKVARSRWGDTGFDPRKFFEIEAGKILHGFYSKTEYFARLVREPREIESSSKPIHTVRCRGIVSEDKYAIFTPCRYRIRELKFMDQKGGEEVSELLSFRGKFTEQAKKGDLVEFKGMVEEYVLNDEKRYRVLLSLPEDYLIPIEILE